MDNYYYCRALNYEFLLNATRDGFYKSPQVIQSGKNLIKCLQDSNDTNHYHYW